MVFNVKGLFLFIIVIIIIAIVNASVKAVIISLMILRILENISALAMDHTLIKIFIISITKKQII